MKLIKRRYDESYFQTIFTHEAPNSQRNHRRLAALLERVPGGRLLEIGCGQGGFLRLAEDHFEVEGVDLSSSAIQALRPRFGERVRVLNVEERPLSPARYHAIAAFNILEHLRQPHNVAEKLCRALARGGVLIGSAPNNFGLVGGLNTRLTNFFDRTHVSTFDPGTWRRIFTRAGFAHIDLFGEVMLGPNRCRYLRGPAWPYLAFNLMFICTR